MRGRSAISFRRRTRGWCHPWRSDEMRDGPRQRHADDAARTVRLEFADRADRGLRRGPGRRSRHELGRAREEPRDWKKLALVVGLGILSWVATYVGMLELIEANMGDLPLVHKIIIGFSVAMLMTMIIWLLDQMFAPNPFFTKLFYAARLRLPDADLGRLRLRLLLESARKPRRSRRARPKAR